MRKSDPDYANRIIHGILAVLSVVLVLLGLILLYASPINWEIVMPPPLWISVAGVILFVASNFIRPGPKISGWLGSFSVSRATSWIVAAVILSVLATVTMVAFSKDFRSNYIPVITFWLMAGMCYLTALWKNSLSKIHLWEWMQNHRIELFLLGIVTLAGIATRFYKLGEVPRVINGDEGRMGLTALSTEASGMANPFALWENFGSLYLQAIYFAFRIFGTTSFAIRLMPAIGGCLAIPAIYVFARQIAGKRVAFISSALLAFSHTHMHFSRTAAVGYIQSTWLVPLELYFLYSGIERRSSRRAALGGILLAIHFSVYLTSQIVVALLLVYLLIVFLFFHSWVKAAFRQILAFWGGFAIMILPEAVYIGQHPLMFIDRLATDGTFQSGWLAQRMAATGQSAFTILAERVIHAFLSLIYYPAIDFYGSPIPTLSLISAALFILGMAMVLFRRQSPGTLLLNGYFWGFAFAIGIFAIPPSADSYRMLMALPAVLIMAAIGLDRILELLGIGWSASRKAYTAVTTVLLASLFVFNLWTYYDGFAGRCLYGDDLAGRFASYLGNYAHTVEKGVKIYLLSNDYYFYGSHASTDFLGRGRTIINFPDPVSQLSLAPGESVVANPDRIAELQDWALSMPQGKLHHVFDCETQIMLVYQTP